MSANIDTSLNERVLDVDTMNATVESETALVPFQQNTPVRFLRGGSQYALWYLAQITRVAPKLWALSMTSSLGRLTQMPHKGGIYNGVAASAIIDDICGVVPHFVGAAFQNVLLYGWLPYVAPSGENGAQTGSAKDNLLKVLFALNATVRDDADGTLRIENLSTAVSAQLDADRIYRDNASVVTEPTVTAVTVLEHQYITGSETTTLFEGTTVDGQVIVFRGPMSNLTATGFTVTESNANYAVVSAGSGTLTGTPYIHTTREITKPVTAAAIPNVVRIEDATLVGVTNSSDVVNRLVDYYSHRTYINVDATIDYEDAGDVVEIYDPFDKVLRQACIEKISPLVVSQTMKGRVSALVGFTPWQVVPFEDEQIIVTENGTVTLPEGVTDVTAVLIGGGSGGQGGYAGEAGANGSSSTASGGNSSSGNGGKGGKGGAAGVGGSGGKVLRVELSQLPADRTFTCNIGTGGEGGAAEGGAGTAGTDSTLSFGDTVISSAEGAASAIGYQDPVSQAFFAQSGAVGAVGGKGGDGISGMGESGGADTTTPAESGESVGANAGGTGSTGYWFNGGSAVVSYTDPSIADSSQHTDYSASDLPKSYSGYSSYSFDSSTGIYTGTGTYSTVTMTVQSAAKRWPDRYTASGQTLTRVFGYFSGSKYQYYVNIFKAKPVYGIAWGKCYGGAGGGGSSGYAVGGNSASPQSQTTRTGGAGASGGSRDAATIYGKGGDGGHGGGGGGGGGGSAIWTHQNASSYTCAAGVGGAGGAGGSGGAGAPGCIILYYRRPVTE